MLERTPPSAHVTARLPGRLTPFIGRQAELDAVLQLLEDPSLRLITLTGAGGVGKTALAQELAGRVRGQFEQGVVFVPLAQLSTIEELLPTLAGTLDVQVPPSGDLQQALLDQLADLHLLLVLDSFEHLLDEAILIREILLAAPRVKILVTSREKLNLEAETLYNLGGLELPVQNDLENLPECDSVALFLQRARQVRPGFSLNKGNSADVVRLCRMVEGNPLGILLAASWVEHFSPSEIVAEAEHSLDFLTRNLRDVEPRHSCLRAVFESSFQRLNEKQKAVFRRLSVFRGGFDLAAAQAVASADLASLISLIEKSMLARVPDTGRYELHGLLHQFAREELEQAGEAEAALAAHAAYYQRFVQQRERRMIGVSQVLMVNEIQAELDNIRQAFSGLVEARNFESVRLMLPGLYWFCEMRSRFYEGEAMFRLAAEGLAPRPGEFAQGAWGLALLSWFDMHMYIEWFESYQDIASQARVCLEQTLSSGDSQGAAASLVLLGETAQHQGDSKTAIRNWKEALRVFPDLDGVYWVNIRIGLCYEADQQYDEAIQAFRVSLERGKRTGEAVKTAWSLENIGETLILQGKPAEAETYVEQALSLFQQLGTPIGVLSSIYSESQVSFSLGKPGRARELAEEAARLARQIRWATLVQKTDAWLRQLDPMLAQAPETAMKGQDEPLSQRELDVLRLLKSEMAGPEIARTLVVSLNTVRFHTKHIYQKLGVNNRLEAIRRARELGL